ncbi:MAG: periplasmic sensor signal transduction histidine kinase [Frankiales bacterium]|jgi:signal transduction histidine kinase|nr:periplasmic sensor signal transduction histidine kinase [Frankiales bacterium]
MSRTDGRRDRLPLAVSAGLLSVAAVLAVALGAAIAVAAGVPPLVGIGAGAAVGLALCAVQVVVATRHAAALRSLHSDALRRLHDPSAPVGRPGGRRLPALASSELADLARVLDALHLRVRVGDEVGERHRRDAETAGAGVFELVSGLVAAEEGARGQLAAELHDTVAQSLMIARGLLATNPSTPTELAKLADYVEDAEEQVRAVMARTRPPALREGDLASAVSGLRADMHNRYGLSVHIDWPASPYPLPLASAITVYRFFQEALLNVVKHADVDDAHVRLRVEEDQVLAEVRDEGPGFAPESVRPDRGRHVGLGLLRERARLSGGAVDVASVLGKGTTLSLRLPRPTTLVPATPAAMPVQRERRVPTSAR